MLVRFKPTGQLGTIDDKEFDPKIYENLSGSTTSNTQTTQQPQAAQPSKQPSMAESIGGALGNLLYQASKPARYAGEGAVSFGRLAADKLGIQKITGDEKPVFLSEDEFKTAADKPVESTVKVAADAASYAVPFGKVAKSSPLLGRLLGNVVAPGAAVGALQGVAQEDANAESIAGNAVLGASGAGALAGLLKLPGLASKGTGKILEKTGDNLALKSLRPSPSQQINFQKETGEKLTDFLSKRNLQGADYSKIEKYIDPIQQQFDEVATNSNLKIDTKSIISKFDEELKRLKKSILPSDMTKATQLQSIKDNFIREFGDKSLTAKELTTLRKEIDKGIKDFSLDASVKGPLNLTRDVVQNAIRDAADNAGVKIGEKTFKETGTELSKLYKLQEIAERQQFLGQGSMPLGLSTLLGANAGGIVGGAVGGGPAGLGLGLLTSLGVNNPRVIAGVSQASSALGNKLQSGNPIMDKILNPSLVGQVGARSGMSVSPPGSNNNNNNNQNIGPNISQSELPPDNSIQQDVNTPQRTISPEQMQQIGLAYAQGQLSKKAFDAVKSAYDVQEETIKNSKPSEGAVQERALAKKASTGLKALERMEKALDSSTSVLTLKSIPGSPGARQYTADESSLIDIIGNIRTGATITPEQQKLYNNLLPQLGDSKETIKAKIKAIKEELGGYSQ